MLALSFRATTPLYAGRAPEKDVNCWPRQGSAHSHRPLPRRSRRTWPFRRVGQFRRYCRTAIFHLDMVKPVWPNFR